MYAEHLSNDGGQAAMTHTFSAHPGHVEGNELEGDDSLPSTDQARELLHTVSYFSPRLHLVATFIRPRSLAGMGP